MTGGYGAMAASGPVLLLIAAGFTYGFARLVGRRHRRALALAGFAALVVGVLLLPSPEFRAAMGSSLGVAAVVAMLALSVALYTWLLRRIRARGASPVEPVEPGLRLITEDDALFADSEAALRAEESGIRRDRFSIAWRDPQDGVVGAVRVNILMSLAELQSLHVREDHRGRGIGAALLRGAEDEARRRGAGRAILTAQSWQAPDFFTRHGWTEARRIPLDDGAARLEMEKPL